MNFIIFFVMFLFSSGVSFISAQETSEKNRDYNSSAVSGVKLSTVKTTGSGQNEDDATKRALQSAVEQVIGLMVYSSRNVENEEMVTDKIHMLSNGFVKSFKKLSSKKEGAVWEVSIEAVVQDGVVSEFLRNSGVESKVDLQNKWAQMTTTLNTKKQAIDLYAAKIQEIKSRLFTVRVIDLTTGLVSKSTPAPFIEDDLDGNAICLWAVRIEPDLEFWNECAYPLLDVCFQNLCVGRKTIRVKYQAASRALSQVLGNNLPRCLPLAIRVAEPQLAYLSKDQDPGLHIGLFGQQDHPYQGKLVFDGQTGLYSVILEKLVNNKESLVTAYFFKEEVIDRLFPKRQKSWSTGLTGMEGRDYLDSWTLEGFVTTARAIDGSKQFSATHQSPLGGASSLISKGNPHDDRDLIRFRSVTDQLVGVIGTPIQPNHIPRGGGPIYFGPWMQCNCGNYSSNGVSEWPMWKDLSCYSKPHEKGWGFNVIHEGKMHPVRKNFGAEPPPFVQFMYLPLILDIPVNRLAEIKEISASLTVKSIPPQ